MLVPETWSSHSSLSPDLRLDSRNSRLCPAALGSRSWRAALQPRRQPWAQSWMKSIQDHGWFLHNPDLGAPWGSDLYDFPMADDVHFFTIRLLCIFVHAPGLLFNLYILLQFPLIACTACFAMRRLGIDSGLALVGSILYAFLPFHLFRCMSHVLLASYYLVPLQVLLVIRLGQGSVRDNRPPLRKRPIGILGLVLFCFIVGGAGIYNAFFGCFLFLLAGIYALLQGRGSIGLKTAGLICLTTSAAVLLHLAPQISYRVHNGLNPEAVIRNASDAELLGLKLAHLLLPIDGHRVAYLARLKDYYLSGGILNNENCDASLGLLASGGFLFLLVHLLCRKCAHPNPQRRGTRHIGHPQSWGHTARHDWRVRRSLQPLCL